MGSYCTERMTRLDRGGAPRPALDGRYELRRPLGHGGTSDVHLAWDRVLEREVAVKILHRERLGDAHMTERFRREALALARLESPHVVGVHDLGSDGDSFYLVMRRVTGRSLEELVRGEGPPSPVRAVRLVGHVLDGLADLHAHRLVHRDIKASNVMVDWDDRAVLVDLGVVLDLRRRKLTPADCAVGTPRFMAPEQRDTGESSVASDLYQVGALLRFVLTGSVNDDNASNRYLFASRPYRLAAVVVRALASDPAARFGSAREMRATLESALVASDGGLR